MFARFSMCVCDFASDETVPMQRIRKVVVKESADGEDGEEQVVLEERESTEKIEVCVCVRACKCTVWHVCTCGAFLLNGLDGPTTDENSAISAQG